MFKIPLIQVPNQAISFNVDSAYWTVRIFQAIDHMCADVSRGGVPIIRGIRCFSGIPLMPYEYMYEPSFGNFIFDADVDWELFDGRVNLFYLTNAEWKAYKALSEVPA
ncbi:hypothetical protein CPT_Maja_019 [Burkholderia phage Maja]|uniref:Cyanophage baseplate Pam3 plug gp18 domain-containing protein n=1 Tax=Burkholderia phage Maja TaxID=2767571 RepID=A0A7S6R7C0_9CAUD|nr:hypothetical protein CPT_Maja_019 [Burkholderia phage Maja]